jgi:serine/threonine protein kinase
MIAAMSQQKGSPVAQWQALSSLYEQACELDAAARAELLESLRTRDPTLHEGLQRMLAAREQADADDFLASMPSLPPAAREGASRDGARVGPYRLARRLGAGGMAEVWLAERDDGAFRRRVAIKLPYARLGTFGDGTDAHAMLRRFDRERDILASLRHPNIAGLIDAGVSEAGEAWLALEYVEGEPIGRWCDSHRSSLRERVRLFRQVLLAVQHAHANLVIHRDLKPANILVTAEGEARLLDFGIAKLLEGQAADETELTRLGGTPLTPRYASPEQLTGAALTTACDVYALGVVFYELVCGLSPYETKTDTVAAIERAIVEAEPRAPSRRVLGEEAAAARGTTVKGLRRALAPELDAIALRCLGKTPAARYSSVDALIADVDRWLNGEAVLARAPGPWARAWKFTVRNKVGVGFSVAAVVALIATAAVAVSLGLEARQESARAGAARDFMLELFKRADAEKAHGADITARELLDAGRRDVLSRLAGQPELQAELLQGIAEIQADMGELTHADVTYSELVTIRSRLGQDRLVARAIVDRALMLVYLNQPAMAADLLEAARRGYRGLPGDAELEARWQVVKGWVDISLDRPEAARAAFEAASAAAVLVPRQGDRLRVEAGRGLVDALRRLGRLPEAEATLRSVSALAEAVPDLPKRFVAWNVSNEIEFEVSVGRFAKVARMMESKVEACDRNFGADSELCRRVFLRSVQTSVRLGRSQLGPDQLARVEAIARDGSFPFHAFEATVALARVRHATATATNAWAERLAELAEPGSDVRLSPLFQAHAFAVLAELDLRKDQPRLALARAERGLALLGGNKAKGSRHTAYLKAVAGISSLQLGDMAKAEALLSEALSESRATQAAEHPQIASIELDLALLRYRQGETEAALTIWDAALPRLAIALGDDSPGVRTARDMRTSLARGSLERSGPVKFFL